MNLPYPTSARYYPTHPRSPPPSPLNSETDLTAPWGALGSRMWNPCPSPRAPSPAVWLGEKT